MRKLFVIISIGLLFTLIQYSNGNPIKSAVSSSEEDDDVESKNIDHAKPIGVESNESDEDDEIKTPINLPTVDSDDESNENIKLSKSIEFIRNALEPESHSHEDQPDYSDIADNNNQKIVEESDEN